MSHETPRELLRALLMGHAMPNGLLNLAVDSIVSHFPQIVMEPKVEWGVHEDGSSTPYAHESKEAAVADFDSMQDSEDENGEPYDDKIVARRSWIGPWVEPSRRLLLSKQRAPGVGEDSTVVIESTEPLTGERVLTRDGRAVAPLRQWLDQGWTYEVLDGRLGA